jgi:flagellar hook-basal body complex protein FliE
MRSVGGSVSVNTLELPGASPSASGLEATEGAGFTDSLKAAVQKVDEMQTSADAESSKLANGAGNLHETMLALEKADVTMKVAMKVRNKVIDAYNDVMRMSV